MLPSLPESLSLLLRGGEHIYLLQGRDQHCQEHRPVLSLRQPGQASQIRASSLQNDGHVFFEATDTS